MEQHLAIAHEVIARCQSLAECTEETGFTTRSFLSALMREVHARLGAWMQQAGMSVGVDGAGNLRGGYPAAQPSARRLFIGSHLDTVPRAGAYDGVLGVVLGVALAQRLNGHRLKFHIEVIGFSEEEGLRFGVPFIGSRALIGAIDDDLLERRDANGLRQQNGRGARCARRVSRRGVRTRRESLVRRVARRISDARACARRVVGDVRARDDRPRARLGLRLGVVEAIAGQSRLEVIFLGQANHAGTTPMNLRRDALAGAAEWITAVEKEACATPGSVATVGRLHPEPGAANVIPGIVRVSLDIRHAHDSVRKEALGRLLRHAEAIAARRGLSVSWERHLDQSAVAMDASLTHMLESAVAASGYPVHRMISGAGHDAMIVAQRMPAAMLFLRSPGGISHHSSEGVLVEDVAAAFQAGLRFLEEMEAQR